MGMGRMVLCAEPRGLAEVGNYAVPGSDSHLNSQSKWTEMILATSDVDNARAATILPRETAEALRLIGRRAKHGV